MMFDTYICPNLRWSSTLKRNPRDTVVLTRPRVYGGKSRTTELVRRLDRRVYETPVATLDKGVETTHTVLV